MSERGTNRAYLSLGSNIDPKHNLPAAVRQLSGFGRVVACSRVWESAPLGANRKPLLAVASENFLNGAVLLETDLSAGAICADVVRAVEDSLGRVRDPHDKNAPRTIDIDLSLFNRDVLTVGHRTIPDPDILTRAFVAVPLAELEPSYLHPTDHRTLAEIAAQLVLTMRLELCAQAVLPLD